MTAADIGLPWDPQIVKPIIIPCYLINTSENPPRFHAGDIIVYSEQPNRTYSVLAPTDSRIVNSYPINPATGHQLVLETNLFRNGRKVSIDINHTSGLVDGLQVGMNVKRGQPILILDRHFGGGGLPDLYIDIAIRNGASGAGPSFANFAPLSYFSFVEMIQDDISTLPSGSVRLPPVLPNYPVGSCKGSQVPNEMIPRLTPTP